MKDSKILAGMSSGELLLAAHWRAVEEVNAADMHWSIDGMYSAARNKAAVNSLIGKHNGRMWDFEAVRLDILHRYLWFWKSDHVEMDLREWPEWYDNRGSVLPMDIQHSGHGYVYSGSERIADHGIHFACRAAFDRASSEVRRNGMTGSGIDVCGFCPLWFQHEDDPCMIDGWYRAQGGLCSNLELGMLARRVASIPWQGRRSYVIMLMR